MATLTVMILLFGADFAICTETANQNTPVVLYANDLYYVFWQDERLLASQSKYSICAARVAPDGTVIDPDGKIVYCDSAASIIDAAYDGSNFLVVFRDPNC